MSERAEQYLKLARLLQQMLEVNEDVWLGEESKEEELERLADEIEDILSA